MTQPSDDQPSHDHPPMPLPIRVDASVLEHAGDGAGHHRLTLEIPGWPGAEPGQFAMLSPGGGTEALRSDPLLPRPMAVYRGHASAAPGSAARVDFLLKVEGRGTRLLADLVPGQAVRLLGPLGTGFPAIAPGSRAVVVGGGTGIASLFELASRGAGQAEVHVVLGARTASALMGAADFEALDVAFHVTTEDGSRGRTGRVTDVLSELLGSAEIPTTLYVCGPTAMMLACRDQAEGAGVDCFVSLENTMACGFGVCLGCAVPVRSGGFSLACRAGPVYAAEEIVWEGLP